MARNVKRSHNFYFLSFSGGRTWKIVMMYMIPIMIFSAVFNIPKFFEFRVTEEKLSRLDPVTNHTIVLNETRVGFQPTDLRLVSGSHTLL